MVNPFSAIESKDLESLKIYLKLGGSPDVYRYSFPGAEQNEDNENEDDGDPLLMRACDREFVDAVYLLLSYGACVDIKDNNDCSSLHNASEQIAHILLINRANPNIQDCDGDTPLHAAVYASSLAIIELLLSYGADHTSKNEEDLTPFSLAEHKLKYCTQNEKEGYKNIHSILQSVAGITEVDSDTTFLNISTTAYIDESVFLQRNKNIDTQLSQLKNKQFLLKIQKNSKERSDRIVSNLNTLKERINTCSTSLRSLQIEIEENSLELRKLTEEEIRNFQGVANMKESLGESFTNKFDDKDYECPICMQIPYPPMLVYQCEEGHVYCSDCKAKPRMERCPQCNISIKNNKIRNRLVENLIAKLYTAT